MNESTRSRTAVLVGAAVVLLATLAAIRFIGTGHGDVIESDAATPEDLLVARSTIQRAMKKTGVAGISVAVAKDGHIVWEHGFGWADRDKRIPATPATIYPLASLSKALTATGLMVLVARGLVDLDKAANAFLPESTLRAPSGNADDATVRHLIFHTAGLPMFWNFVPQTDADYRSRIDHAIASYGIIVSEPGAQYRYSNLGYGVIDRIISAVSGRPYREFMRDEVFEPLGMTHTSVLPDPQLNTLTATMYDARKRPLAPYDFDHRGASAALSNVRDLLRFGMFQLRQPLPFAHPILSDETLAEMHREVGASFQEEDSQTVVEYLLGSFGRVDYAGYGIEVASGSMPGAAARLTLVPAENLVSVILCNGDNIDLWEIEKIILEAMLPNFTPNDEAVRRSRSPATGGENARAGDYVGTWSGSMVTDATTIPIELTFFESGSTRLEINGTYVPTLKIRTSLGKMGFDGSVFRGLYDGHIDTPEATRASHVLFLECRADGRRLTGYAAAIAVNRDFCLPYWMELRRLLE